MVTARRSPAAFAAVLLLSAALAVLGAARIGSARADRAGTLRGAVSSKRATERSLLSGIAHDNSQINRFQGSIGALQGRLNGIEAKLRAERAQLAQIQKQARIEQARLTRLELQLQKADTDLTGNLVSSYEADQPDALTVILNAKGFAALIEGIDYLKRIKDRNAQVITADRRARIRVIAEASRLGALEARQQKITASIAQRRNQVDGLRLALVRRQLVFVDARARKRGALSSIAATRRSLENQLSRLQGAQRRAVLRSSGVGPVSGRVLSGGGFTFPLPAGAGSPPGSWTQDQGVDISAAGNTPELAVGGGTIVLHGIGGFGSWAPVLHLDSPIGGQSYVYYGHAGPAGELPVGSHVGAGQVLGSIGPGIVGISTGPHLEIGFADASGTPAPGTSGTMLALLNAAYHG